MEHNPVVKTLLDPKGVEERTEDMLRDLIGRQYSSTTFRVAEDYIKQERRLAIRDYKKSQEEIFTKNPVKDVISELETGIASNRESAAYNGSYAGQVACSDAQRIVDRIKEAIAQSKTVQEVYDKLVEDNILNKDALQLENTDG